MLGMHRDARATEHATSGPNGRLPDQSSSEPHTNTKRVVSLMANIRNDLSTKARIYIQTAYGEPVVAELKSLGCHWDAQTKCWWIGVRKRKQVEELLVASDKAKEEGGPEKVAETKEDIDRCRVYAKVTYKRKSYYVIAETNDVTWCRLTTLEGETPFWVDCADCDLIRRYEGRQVWDGRRYSGKTVMQYSTIGSMRAFRDSQSRAREEGMPPCAACGKHGFLIEDNEDGMMKCRACCDMPSE